MQDLHRLIKRQVKKFFGDLSQVPKELLPLLQAIGSSYSHYESDRILIERAMELSSSELAQSNKKLFDESKKHKMLIKSLKESLKSLSDVDVSFDDDDLLRIADVLQDEIRKRKVAEEAIKRSEEKYRSVIENMDLGLIEMDMDGVIINVYDRFCVMIGFSKQELLGKRPLQFIKDPESRGIALREEAKLKKGISDVYEIQMVTKDGNTVWVIVSSAPVFCAEGDVCGSLAVHFDITHRNEIEGELKTARTKAEQSLKSKELFLANISHEIRTPMNAIIGMSRLLIDTSLDRMQMDFLRAIRTSADGLLVIINDVLDMSKIESGKFSIEHIQFNIQKLVSDLQLSMAFKAEEKGIYLQCEVDPELQKNVVGDPTRLNQVLVNLVNNAIKFTNTGGVDLKVERVSIGENSDLVRFSVQDTGMGIEEEKLDAIFDSFTQEDSTISRKFGGTGLGLAICKQLVNIFGGRFKVGSVKGEGSSFSFEINLEHGKEENIIHTIPAEDQHLDGCRVLLVEDNELNRFLAITILKKWGAEVIVAEHGQIAVDLLQDNNFDIILMDMQMPQLDGVGATRVIRKEMKLRTPIIALTANAITGEREKCLKAGMDDYISKPFEPGELYSKMRRLIDAEMDDNEYLTMGDAPRFSLDKLKALYRGNQAEMMHTVEIFIVQIAMDVEELCSKAESDNRKAVSELAHKMKPNIELFQIEEITDEIKFLEQNCETIDREELLELTSRLKMVTLEVSKEMKNID